MLTLPGRPRLWTTLVQLIKAVQPKVDAQSDKPDADALREFTSSIKIEQHKDRMVLTASLPLELVKKLATPMSDAVSGAPAADTGQAGCGWRDKTFGPSIEDEQDAAGASGNRSAASQIEEFKRRTVSACAMHFTATNFSLIAFC